MKNMVDFFLNNPLLLLAVAILVIALAIALMKKVMKAAVVISLIIVILGVSFYFVRDKLGFKSVTAPVENVLQKGNKAVESTSPSTFEKVRSEFGSRQKMDSVKKAGSKKLRESGKKGGEEEKKGKGKGVTKK